MRGFHRPFFAVQLERWLKFSRDKEKKDGPVLIRDWDKFYEGLHTSLGLILVDHRVSTFGLGHKIPVHKAYCENKAFLILTS